MTIHILRQIQVSLPPPLLPVREIMFVLNSAKWSKGSSKAKGVHDHSKPQENGTFARAHMVGDQAAPFSRAAGIARGPPSPLRGRP